LKVMLNYTVTCNEFCVHKWD